MALAAWPSLCQPPELEVQIPLIIVSQCQAQQGRHNTAEHWMGQLCSHREGTRLHGGCPSPSPVVLFDMLPSHSTMQGARPLPIENRCSSEVGQAPNVSAYAEQGAFTEPETRNDISPILRPARLWPDLTQLGTREATSNISIPVWLLVAQPFSSFFS